MKASEHQLSSSNENHIANKMQFHNSLEYSEESPMQKHKNMHASYFQARNISER